jgi:hypothetical protein
MKHGCTIMNLQANFKAWSGNMSLLKTKKFRSVTSADKTMLTLFWDLMGLSSSTTRNVDRQSIVHRIFAVFEEGLKPTIRNKRRGILTELFCTMTTLDVIQQQRPLKRFESWNCSFSPAQHTVKILPHLITTLSNRSKIRYVDADLQTLKHVKDAVNTWLRAQLETFLADGKKKLVDQSNKCVEKLGDCVEN